MTYTGQGMETVYDYRVGWTTINAYLFNVVWNDGLTCVAMVNPEFGSVAAAQVEAEIYGAACGKVPTCLRTGVHARCRSTQVSIPSVVVTTPSPYTRTRPGIHRRWHPGGSFRSRGDPLLVVPHARCGRWLGERTKRGRRLHINVCAELSHNGRSAPSMLPWLAVRFRASRISATDYNTITTTIPNRLDYIDDILCAMYPINSGIGIEEEATSTIGIFPSPASDWLTLRTDRPLPANTRFELLAMDGRIVRSATLAGQARVDVSDVTPGIYLWRCHDAGRPLATGTVSDRIGTKAAPTRRTSSCVGSPWPT